MRRDFFVHMLAALTFSAFVIDAAHAAKPRGQAGTATRAEYCREQYDNCKANGERECVLDQMHWDQAVYNSCAGGVENACRSYFLGSTSACNTQARIMSIRGIFDPAVKASRASQGSKSRRLPTTSAPATQR